jgi:putative colanic acid biosysnthesis UDP-glucose lipid carrier transferase
MFQSAGESRQFIHAPPSVAGFLSAFMEPLIGILCYMMSCLSFDVGFDRASVTLCLLTLALSFPGTNRFHQKMPQACFEIVMSWLTLLIILALCGYATDSFQFFSHKVLIAWAISTPLIHTAVTLFGISWLRRYSSSTAQRRTAVVVGGGPLGVKLCTALQGPHGYGREVAGFFDDRDLERLDPSVHQQHLGNLASVRDYVTLKGIKEVYITLPMSSQPRIVRLLSELQDTTASLYLVPDVFGVSVIRGRLEDIGGVPVVGLLETPFTGANRLLKRVSDIVLSALILVLISPVLGAVAIAVKMSSPGPAIFKQRRNGLDGQEIIVYKFRSMRTQDNGAVVKQAQRGDPRVTKIGAFLRKTSLDELPQFINVLQGRMSIVGPRPHAVAHNQQYRGMITAYMVRHKVKPGITGWAQVNGHRGETDTIDKMQARVEFDLEYLRNWSLALDLQIIARTVKLVLMDRNAY